MTVTYLDRAAWGAGPVTVGRAAPHGQFIGLVAHHTVFVSPDYDRDGIVAGDLDDVKRYMRWLQHARPDLGPDVPYSFVVFEGARPGDCVVAEGRGFGRTGAHTSGFNSSRYGCALAGNSSTRPVTPGVLEGYRWIGRRLSNPAGAEPTIGHRDTKSTECPGHSLYAHLPQIQPPFTPAEEEDMPLTADDLEAIRTIIEEELTQARHGYGQVAAQLSHEEINEGFTKSGSVIRRALLEMDKRGVNETLGADQGDDSRGLLKDRLDAIDAELAAIKAAVVAEEPTDPSVPPTG